jgi:3-oxoacyl-[acyl-carrier protein] reductase
MDIHFPGRTVIVTGAARGIGAGIVHAFAARGAEVWACDLLSEELRAVAAAAPLAEGGRVETRRVDATVKAEVEDFVAEASAARGRIDVLVHVAGGVRGQSRQPAEAVSEGQWHDIVDANLTAAFLCAQAVIPGMKAAGTGRIVTISSRAGLGVSLTGIQSYAASKAGQIGLVRQLAHELGPFGITVNTIAPGFLRTSPDYERQWNSYGPEGQAQMIDRIAMRRLGEPEDIAHGVLFLASPFASWITGQVLQIGGNP